MKYVITNLFPLLKKSFQSWNADKAPMMGAAVAYYTIFSISPLLLVIISILGIFFGHAIVQQQMLGEIGKLLGPEASKTIATMLEHARKPSASILASIIGVITLLVGASGVCGQLKDALNSIWKVKSKPSAGFLKTIRDRFLSFSMILVIGFLLLVSLIASASIAAVTTLIHGIVPFAGIFAELLNFVISFSMITALFFLILKYLPDIRVPSTICLYGAALTSFLFTIGKMAIGLYIGNSALSTTYGAAASLIIILLWVYYSIQILFFGAEFTKVFAYARQVSIRPHKDAVITTPITEIGRKESSLFSFPQFIGYVISGLIVEIIQRAVLATSKKRKRK